MDIRKGNDVVVYFDEDKLGLKDGVTLKSVRCFFIRETERPCNCNSSCTPSQYTIHNCGLPTYNVPVAQAGT